MLRDMDGPCTYLDVVWCVDVSGVLRCVSVCVVVVVVVVVVCCVFLAFYSVRGSVCDSVVPEGSLSERHAALRLLAAEGSALQSRVLCAVQGEEETVHIQNTHKSGTKHQATAQSSDIQIVLRQQGTTTGRNTHQAHTPHTPARVPSPLFFV